ncbi:hypothetical protein N9N28_15125 [Rubripirellula amarantea]|nr:hypothetical protein [Rubripirellula amarantea]
MSSSSLSTDSQPPSFDQPSSNQTSDQTSSNPAGPVSSPEAIGSLGPETHSADVDASINSECANTGTGNNAGNKPSQDINAQGNRAQGNRAQGNRAQGNHAQDNGVQDNGIQGQYVTADGQCWYKIGNVHRMRDFFVSVVSSSDHWMFISSSGALSAGRRNAESALFPYYSSDKIQDHAGCTGPKTIVRVGRPNGQTELWEPFSAAPIRDQSRSRNLYKNAFGNRLRFEEVHHDLGLSFSYTWSTGHRFGFIRRCELVNLRDAPRTIDLTDGLENLLPPGLGKDFQLRFSNLGDAYKKNELLGGSGIGLYYLSSIPTDRAEPNEGLRTTVAWQHGLPHPTVSLSSESLENIRRGAAPVEQHDVRGRRGAYFASRQVELCPGEPLRWTTVADVNYDHSDVVELDEFLTTCSDVNAELAQDEEANEERLLQILSSADGVQMGADRMRTERHKSNVLFNVMRGGLPANGYEVKADDFRHHVRQANRLVASGCEAFLDSLPETLSMADLQARVAQSADSNLVRLASEYLPLCFSRRHGDPTRPWNEFSIDVWTEDGEPNLSYEGNWRDIFQNWEALSIAFPNYLANMVFRFAGASTADGHNPYRITKNGFEWEVPDADDPWSNIGYWGDHQIIYFQKLLQWGRLITPDRLNECLSQDTCTYANVPYHIRSHKQICLNPQVTIDFDDRLAEVIARRVESVGSDGKLLWNENDEPYRVSLTEKLIVPALAKLTNFVPGGGIWLNTQRPEWNDANNALVGRGLSMVTVCYLRRYLTFLIDWFSSNEASLPGEVLISREVWQLIQRVQQILVRHASSFDSDTCELLDARTRKVILDQLATAGSDYRNDLYEHGLCGQRESLSLSSLVDHFVAARKMVDHTIRANRRDDGLYHSYNLLDIEDESANVTHMYEMLEGQVAVLSSGLLKPQEALEVLDALRNSRMYREDQHSYMLYPDRELPRFMEKNIVPAAAVARSRLLTMLVDQSHTSVVRKDLRGNVHFNGNLCNVSDFKAALDALSDDERFSDAVAQERRQLCQLFEETFGHQHFTGRSGTFFGYEGLGSIYWHMVSKLSLAVMEQCLVAQSQSDRQVIQRLHEHYRDVRNGIGTTKTPLQYGAFPSDPYSHTPSGAGVQQPGMTGQVKEDILSRWDEIGIRLSDGQVRFDLAFFETSELLEADASLEYFDVNHQRRSLEVPAGCFAFTLCQVPILYERHSSQRISVDRKDQSTVVRDDLLLTSEESRSLFSRDGEISSIKIQFPFDTANR